MAPYLLLIRGGTEAHRLRLTRTGLSVGRDPDNDLIVADSDISRQHAIFWLAEGVVWLRDVASRNGTRVDGELLVGARPIDDSNEILLGDAVHLRTLDAPPVPESTSGPVAMAELRPAGIRVAIPQADGPEGGVLLPGSEGARAWRDDDGAVLVDLPGQGLRELSQGAHLTIGDQVLRLVGAPGAGLVTIGASDGMWPYRVAVSLGGAGGAAAVVTDLDGQEQAQITAETRVNLLFLLARNLLDDMAANLPPAQRGWVADEDAIVGVWGKRGQEMDLNSLHVLVYRVRQELANAGLEGDCIEKRRGGLRLRVREVQVD